MANNGHNGTTSYRIEWHLNTESLLAIITELVEKLQATTILEVNWFVLAYLLIDNAVLRTPPSKLRKKGIRPHI